MFALGICDDCLPDDEGGDEDEEPQETRGSMHDADDYAYERWTENYDERNGAPEDDDDR